MSLQIEWKAISDRIQGLLQAGQLFLQATYSSDPYSIIKKDLIPHSKAIFEQISRFHGLYKHTLHSTATEALERFLLEYQRFVDLTEKRKDDQHKLVGTLSRLASFQSEFTYQLSDIQAAAKRITERAFIHLQRCIIADHEVGKRWKEAFEEGGEPACERLGGAHLLHHGIWAFKAHAEGERTDLVLGEPLEDLSEVESAAVTLVLTEWKVLRTPKELDSKAKEAYKQAKIYGLSSMAGFELGSYRYLVLVSKERILELPSDISEQSIIYRYINVAVMPEVPSKAK